MTYGIPKRKAKQLATSAADSTAAQEADKESTIGGPYDIDHALKAKLVLLEATKRGSLRGEAFEAVNKHHGLPSSNPTIRCRDFWAVQEALELVMYAREEKYERDHMNWMSILVSIIFLGLLILASSQPILSLAAGKTGMGRLPKNKTMDHGGGFGLFLVFGGAISLVYYHVAEVNRLNNRLEREVARQEKLNKLR